MPSDPNSTPPEPKAEAADRGGGDAAPPQAVMTLPVIALPVFLAPAGFEPPCFMGQYAMTHQAVLATVTAQAQIQMQMQMQNIYPPTSELMSSTFSQPGLSTLNPAPLKQCPASVPEAKNPVPLKQQLSSVPEVRSPEPLQQRPSSVSEVKCPEPLQQRPSSVLEVNCPEPLQQRPSSVLEVNYPEPLQHRPSPVPEVKSSEPLQQQPSPIPDVKSPEPFQQRPSPVHEVKSPEPLQRRPSSVPEGSAVDAYYWRKYGQKHIKSSDNSRSYYKCTDSNCSAKKKVERCPDGTIVDITYVGKHTHDPPRKYRYTQDKGQQTSGASGECGILEKNSCSGTPEQHLHCSSDCEVIAGMKEVDVTQESDAKRRHTESPIFSMPVQKTVREYIVQTEIDARHLSDGYRWRKYGQKIVKGNPNPRSYYRCTHEGCPVRKHLERASHDANALLITYEGKHNHDQPASKYSSNSTASTPKADIAASAGEKLDTSSSSLDNKVLEESHAEKLVKKEVADEKPQELQNK